MARGAARSAAVSRTDALNIAPNVRRLAALLVVCAALAPGTWLRTDPAAGSSVAVNLAPLAVALPAQQGDLVREGLWEITSPSMEFGGYSAMYVLGGGRLRLFSDRGSRLFITLPPAVTPVSPNSPFANVWDIGPFSNRFADIESTTRDPATGDYWLGFESFNGVGRYDVASSFVAARRPPEMRNWPINGGAEAMVRLADGHFLILPENHQRGLLFNGDPTQEGRAQTFAFSIPAPYYATDMAALPDGRVLILARGLQWQLPPFTARLYLADPADITTDTVWTPRLVAELDGLLPHENYEALAIVPQGNGEMVLWIASDDNLAALQRTLLARLRWRLPPLPESDVPVSVAVTRP